MVGTKRCNFCLYQNLERYAKKEDQVVTRIPDRHYELGGIDVYIHPSKVKIAELPNEEARQMYWRGWFMEIPDECCC